MLKKKLSPNEIFNFNVFLNILNDLLSGRRCLFNQNFLLTEGISRSIVRAIYSTIGDALGFLDDKTSLDLCLFRFSLVNCVVFVFNSPRFTMVGSRVFIMRTNRKSVKFNNRRITAVSLTLCDCYRYVPYYNRLCNPSMLVILQFNTCLQHAILQRAIKISCYFELW